MNRKKFILPIIYTLLCVPVAWWWFGRSSAKHVQERKVEAKVAEMVHGKLDTIPGRAGHLLLVDSDLYDAVTGEVLFKGWLKGDASVRLFFDPKEKKFIGQYPKGFARYGLDGRQEAEIAGKYTLEFSDDLKRVFFAREKNVWMAEPDWQNFRLARERQVTTIGSFYENYFAENLQLLTEKTLVVRNLNNLLRVNLETGDVHPARIPLRDIGKRRSPDSKWVVGMEGAQFYCYDVDAGEMKTIPVGRGGAMNDFQWLGNDRCLGLVAGKAIVVYDRLANSLTEVAELPFPCFKIGEPSPDGRFVFCAGGMGGRDGALVDTVNKTAERITGGAGICWVSNDTFAFSREVPDSDLRGTWLQTSGQAERRISPEPFLVGKAGPQLLALPSAGLVIFATKNGLTKMKPDGTELAELVKLPRPPARVVGIQEWKME